MPQHTRRRAAVTSPQRALRDALDAEQLVLHFQPIVELAQVRPVGVEALLRWRHPEGGLLSPDDFLPAVVQSPVITELTRWVLKTACAAGAAWPGWTVSVNITARDIVQPSFADEVQDALRVAGLRGERLVLELTETALVQDLARAAKTLRELREVGVGIALDDFGTGYSSMLYLRDLPLTSVKIDREFVLGVDRATDNRAIVSSVLALAKAVGLTAVAEGVETRSQAQALLRMGCPYAQGYLWSHPVPPAELSGLHLEGIAGPALVAPPVDAPDGDPRGRALELLEHGASLHTIAAALNAEGYRTDKGTRWHATSAGHLVSRDE